VARDRRRDVADRLRPIVQRWSQPTAQWRAKVQHWVDAGIVSPPPDVEIVAAESGVPTKLWRAAMNQPSLSPIV